MIEMPFYSRKSPRIPNFDYTSENYYFITICTDGKKCFFGKPDRLNDFGKIAAEHIIKIETHYDTVIVDKYVVMPNHVHFILVTQRNNKVSVEQVIAQYKAGVSREIRKIHPDIRLWQRSFHDHVIRDQKGYEKIRLYIENNPQLWVKDNFYVTEQNE